MGLLDRVTFQKQDVAPPEAIEVVDGNVIEIHWPGGAKAAIPAKALRDACPCAGCIEEGTGKKLLDPATIPDDIHPTRFEPVGSYAVRIGWSDGHDTGLYTWRTLRQVSGLP